MNDEIYKNLIEQAQEKEMIEEAIETFKRNISDEKIIHNASRVAENLKKMEADDKTIAAAFLHYLPDNINFSIKSIAKDDENLIWEITKKAKQLQELYYNFKKLKPKPIKNWQKTLLSEQGENLRKMFFAVTKDPRPIFIFLTNQWEIMKRLKDFPEEKQKWHAQGSLEILAPLAYGLGMLEAKGKLEDLAFPFLYPQEYSWLLKNVNQLYEDREGYLNSLTPKIPSIFQKENITFLDIHKRAKHYFSLYQKLLRHDMDLNRIYDLVALRIIVPDIENCYKALGVLHKTWEPLQGRIKDYISQPKLNGYRSLHTTVKTEDNIITEFQIKTPQMHQEAEYGVAAHLGYKNIIPEQQDYKHQFYWMEKIRQLEQETKAPDKILNFLQYDFLKDQVFVLSPKGDIVNLPKGATPIDFAYSIHSDLGEHIEVAKIDGKAVTLNTELKTGQTVEIITNKKQTPSEKWLRFVKTRKAQEKIRKFLYKDSSLEPKKPKIIETITKSITGSIAGGITGISEGITETAEFIKKIIPLPKLKKKEPSVMIGGESGISFKLSKCCNPKPQDKIIAFITQGESASIHKQNCENFISLKEKFPERVMEAKWQQ